MLADSLRQKATKHAFHLTQKIVLSSTSFCRPDLRITSDWCFLEDCKTCRVQHCVIRHHQELVKMVFDIFKFKNWDIL